MTRVAITTLGCKTNQFESAAMSEALGREGYIIVPFSEQADIYIVNTCSVTARTDVESRRIIRRAKRQNVHSRVVVTGCYAQVATDELQKVPGISLIIGNEEKKRVVEFIRGLSEDQQVMVSDIMLHDKVDSLELESFAEHTRAFLQIQTGCDAFCSYCIVPYARGRSRSVPFDDVLKGVKRLAEQGYKEVVLSGIHLGVYGMDLKPPQDLLELLRKAEDLQYVPRLRIGSLEPQEISSELIDLLSHSITVCPHLHIPMQSGSNSVLERMNRRYTAEYFSSLVFKIVKAVPDICIGLDMIAGFPGETEKEFLAGYDLVKSLPISYLHVFPYSSRPGTAAAQLPDHLSFQVVKDRAERLRILGESKRSVFYQKFVGEKVPVLLQNKSGKGVLKGLSRNYLPVRLPADESMINSEQSVKILKLENSVLIGELVC